MNHSDPRCLICHYHRASHQGRTLQCPVSGYRHYEYSCAPEQYYCEDARVVPEPMVQVDIYTIPDDVWADASNP